MSAKAGFQPPSGDKLPHTQTFSPKLVSQVTANSRLKVAMLNVISIKYGGRSLLMGRIGATLC
jgi:hypothetical protein